MYKMQTVFDVWKTNNAVFFSSYKICYCIVMIANKTLTASFAHAILSCNIELYLFILGYFFL